MCLERVTQLKCGHPEPYRVDHCESHLLRACEKYKAVVVRVEQSRSCAECKLVRAAMMGFASPGLTRL
jgi:hypothetical protein